MKNENHNNDTDRDNIPNVEIDDPYDYVSSNRTIANLVIKGRQVEQRRSLIRTKRGGYMMQ